MALKKCNLVYFFLLIYSIIVIILRFDFSVFYDTQKSVQSLCLLPLCFRLTFSDMYLVLGHITLPHNLHFEGLNGML